MHQEHKTNINRRGSNSTFYSSHFVQGTNFRLTSLQIFHYLFNLFGFCQRGPEIYETAGKSKNTKYCVEMKVTGPFRIFTILLLLFLQKAQWYLKTEGHLR